MDKNVSIRLINIINSNESRWFITINDEQSSSVIISRHPKETYEHLMEELKSLQDLTPMTISTFLDKKSSVHLY